MFSATIDPHIMDILMRDMEKIHQETEETYIMTEIPEELITEKAPEIKTPTKNPVIHTKRIIKLPKLRRNQTKSLRTQILARIQKQKDDILERRQKIINRLAAKIWKPLNWVKQI
ncbi:hypothetical protein GCK72_021694 [Caenorhabditis remanei]|uniref:Uncharacterized protein n=1 Tax=Caenorhabditis remanei TaxID=31234 RepID=A0A6A5GKS0_CAERE|nr:hypothetical protein GCK72_021694 [Caenorhabditis remanei]KAF1755125.1 hypothetical protein GCK72_021694 [Caenorhabditis remanei]